MGGRAGGGARGGGGAGKGSIEDRLRARYAAMSDKERYKEKQWITKNIESLANYSDSFEGYNPNAYTLNKILDSVQAKGGFAADVAASVKKTVNTNPGMYERPTAKMSSKQAWILGSAIVDKAIVTHLNDHVTTVQKIKVTSKWGGKTKTKKIYTFTPI